MHVAFELKFWHTHSSAFWFVSSQCQNSEKNSGCKKKKKKEKINQLTDGIKLKKTFCLNEFMILYYKSSDELIL